MSSIYTTAVGNTPYGKRHTSGTIHLDTYASAVYLGRKLTFEAIFLALLTDRFNAFFNPKKRHRDERYE